MKLKKADRRLIEAFIDNGYKLYFGRHDSLKGYFAVFIPFGCSQSNNWNETGHAKTLGDAIRMAADLVLCHDVIVPRIEDFE